MSYSSIEAAVVSVLTIAPPSVTIYPSSDVVKQLAVATPDIVNHYSNVNNPLADPTTNYNENNDDVNSVFYKDLYGLQSITQNDAIASVTAYMKGFTIISSSFRQGKVAMRTGGVDFEGTAVAWTGFPVIDTISKVWAVNPNTLITWTKAEINALNIGPSIQRIGFCSLSYAVIAFQGPFTSDSCKAADGKMFGKGLPKFCLISYNSDRTEELTIKTELRKWLLNVDVFVPWHGDLTELEQRVDTEVQLMKNQLAAYPRLNSATGVLKAILTTGNPKDVLQTAKGSYRGKRSILEVHEIVKPARAD